MSPIEGSTRIADASESDVRAGFCQSEDVPDDDESLDELLLEAEASDPDEPLDEAEVVPALDDE